MGLLLCYFRDKLLNFALGRKEIFGGNYYNLPEKLSYESCAMAVVQDFFVTLLCYIVFFSIIIIF